MGQKQNSKKGVPGSAGKRKAQFARYEKRYSQHKLRRILQSNGPKAAMEWANEHSAFGTLYDLASPKTKVGRIAQRAINKTR